ncbi:MAG: hypothetical protein BRC25_02030 [Parcubacteria group bacterium SW_6_46_9]|nr:MAG: hypothetical protein BRC25_02030 [Parcubacteria group bacterium SW_6_46_9]
MKKLITTSVFAFAIFVVFGTGIVYAQNNDRIQTLIDRVQTLQSQVFEQGANSNDGSALDVQTATCPDLDKDLSIGDTGESVRKLQKFLNNHGFTVAGSGPGSSGQETTYFGPATQQAVRQFQKQYSEVVLAPLGLSGPTGVWGNSSQSKAEDVCKSGNKTDTEVSTKTSGELSSFSSAEDFRSYIENSRGGHSASFGASSFSPSRSVGATGNDMETTALQSQSLSDAAGDAESGDRPDRFSQTNVQEQGIDEPDILKTDGEHIFFSDAVNDRTPDRRRMSPTAGEDANPDIQPPNQEKLRIIDALPPENAQEIANIKETGDLLLSDNTLVVLADDQLIGIDVTEQSNPAISWREDLADDQRVHTARLKDGQIQLVTKTNTDRSNPCPIPLQDGLTVGCTDVLHPEYPVNAEVTYHVSVVSPGNGEISHKLSLVGARDATIYVSDSGMYVGYTKHADRKELVLSVLSESDVVDDSLVRRLKKVTRLNISEKAKQKTAFANYIKENKRELTTTHLVKIDVSAGVVAESGEGPGELLNQFSLDASDGNLRVATTVGELFGQAQSANDVYVLDESLEITGSVKDLGLTERIYSVRFMEDTAYVVTFRQIDPFYVLDLSDPQDPEMRGEVKLPGYSSYLHPLPNDRVVGIGEEDGQVKATLFDVSNKDNPSVLSSYILDEYRSDAVENHHAFLADREHEVIFVPGQKGGYILSYAGSELTLKKSVADVQARRALYINDTLYVVGDDKIVAVDETDWTRTRTLEF